LAYLIDSNDCRAAAGKSQNMRSARNLQVKQLSMMSRPYGVSTTQPPVTPNHMPGVGAIWRTGVRKRGYRSRPSGAHRSADAYLGECGFAAECIDGALLLTLKLACHVRVTG